MSEQEKAITPEKEVDEQYVEELVAEREHTEYLKKRHKQVIDDLKVSSTSAKPHVVMGFALLAVLVVVIIIAYVIA